MRPDFPRIPGVYSSAIRFPSKSALNFFSSRSRITKYPENGVQFFHGGEVKKLADPIQGRSAEEITRDVIVSIINSGKAGPAAGPTGAESMGEYFEILYRHIFGAIYGTLPPTPPAKPKPAVQPAPATQGTPATQTTPNLTNIPVNG